MLSRPGSLPTGQGWSYELKWGGFRALVSTEDELRPKPTRMEHETKPDSASQGLMLPELHPGGRRFESA